MSHQYRYCPASEPLTEACFAAHPLAFAHETHTIRYANASQDVEIPVRCMYRSPQADPSSSACLAAWLIACPFARVLSACRPALLSYCKWGRCRLQL